MTAGRILALDVGERRIGVALSDPLRLVARPLTVVQRASKAKDLAAIGRLVAEHQVDLVICGYPLSLDVAVTLAGRQSFFCIARDYCFGGMYLMFNTQFAPGTPAAGQLRKGDQLVIDFTSRYKTGGMMNTSRYID